VEQRVEHHQVCARHGLQVSPLTVGGEVSRRAAAGVHHHQAPARPHPGQVSHRRRHRLGKIAAQQEDRVCLGKVGEREWQATVDAERAVGRGGGAAHAEPTVVVNVRGAQGDAGELAQHVGLLVGQATAPENGHGVGAVLGADRP